MSKNSSLQEGIDQLLAGQTKSDQKISAIHSKLDSLVNDIRELQNVQGDLKKQFELLQERVKQLEAGGTPASSASEPRAVRRRLDYPPSSMAASFDGASTLGETGMGKDPRKVWLMGFPRIQLAAQLRIVQAPLDSLSLWPMAEGGW